MSRTDQTYKRVTGTTSQTIVVPTHDRDISRGVLRKIILHAGWTEESFAMLVEKYK